MHDSVRSWVTGIVATYQLAALDVLEVGALDENGSVRGLFSGPYIGVDMRDGPGVDQVMDGHDLKFAARRFDVVVCTEVLEHDEAFWLTLAEIGRVLRPGGHLLLTTRGNGFQLHEFPSDYWRFMPSTDATLVALAGCVLTESMPDPQAPGIFIHGTRR